MRTSQDEIELAVFRRFAEVSGLPIQFSSIAKRQPPEPDIFCSLSNGQGSAFELIEICNGNNAKFMAASPKIHDALTAEYNNLSSEYRVAFDRRFLSHPLSFSFKEDASLNRIRNAIHSLMIELISSSPCNDEFVSFSKSVTDVVAHVRFRGRMNNFDAVNFNIGGEFDSAISLDAISAKLGKHYHSNYPIELLAYFGHFACSKDHAFDQALVRLLNERGLGVFRRVWVLRDGIAKSVSARCGWR